jgi:hypothetical protein
LAEPHLRLSLENTKYATTAKTTKTTTAIISPLIRSPPGLPFLRCTNLLIFKISEKPVHWKLSFQEDLF